jgi:hypothetical protein
MISSNVDINISKQYQNFFIKSKFIINNFAYFIITRYTKRKRLHICAIVNILGLKYV